ncbi:hypothetical protein GCM10027046_35980 [Uliginosibacterium flavum]|uniref:Sigma-E factor negative regulatory protein n=1 Tax=Uliginosibacterium flavum TaxID=1396831 RepID=A0ABV2TPI8_9RHOO
MANEQLSAWLDGELGATESEILVKNLERHAVQREACSAYWLIGDCLRGDTPRTADLSSRIMAALEAEPAILAPVANKPRQQLNHWMPVAAAAAGVGVAVWMGLSLWTMPLQDAPATLAQTPVSPSVHVVSAEAAGALSDERSYLMAHQASARGAPMAGVTQYIRSVSIEQAGER